MQLNAPYLISAAPMKLLEFEIIEILFFSIDLFKSVQTKYSDLINLGEYQIEKIETNISSSQIQIPFWKG